MDNLNEWKVLVTALVGSLTAFWGWMGWLVIIWIGLMFLDYISGTFAALKEGTWSSAVARDGMWHKMAMIIVVVATAVADGLLSIVLAHLPIVHIPFNFSGFICPLTLVWYSLTELGSIIENAVVMEAGVPEWLTKLLAICKNVVDESADVTSDENDDSSENE